MSAPRRHSRASRGYTLVELMMSLALIAVSVLGIVSLQKVTVVTNAHAKNLAMAQRIAQAWAGQLQMDSTQWVATMPSGTFLNSSAVWGRPDHNVTRNFGAAFDALGNPLADTALAGARFCTHVRMSWLFRDTMSVAGNGMLRAEIRVFWLRDGSGPLGDNTASMCAKQGDEQVRNIGFATDRYHFVYQTVGLRQHYQI